MTPSRFEQAQRLFRALEVREAELKANEEVIKKAQFRSHSLREAVEELRTSIAQLLGDASVGELAEQLPLQAESAPVAQGIKPALARTDTILARVVAFLESEHRVLDATEIAQALRVGIDVVRTTLSKLFARGLIAKHDAGEYSSLAYAHEIGTGSARKARGS